MDSPTPPSQPVPSTEQAASAPAPQTQPPPMLHESGYQTDEVQLGMWAHLIPVIASALGLGAIAFVGPLVILYSSRKPSSYVDEHAKESLNFQISLIIYFVALMALTVIVGLITFGFGFFIMIPAIIAFAIAGLVFEIIATVAAAQGKPYQYPLTIRFVK